ncbi:hypothetical protein F2Q68_00045730 [Brassica cretica]|uniref:Uncharacterized protein n=1 Tax=Brassica cretica TaxID=69181 RepID=A0A8S9LV55_BRACR|nr:hypothetical protein F2Q68_00045730 [Brassica cretica]
MKPLTSPIKRSSYSMRAPDNSNARKEKEIFKERVDRHGNSFGVRVTTKKTRNPPPERYWEKPKTTSNQVWTRKPEAAREPEYTSPPFTININKPPMAGSQGRAIFTQREHTQWRPKELEGKALAEKAIVPHVQENQTPGEKANADGNPVRISTHEEVMEQLHEMEETAAAIIAAELKRAALSALEAASNCNPVTPPPLQNYVPQVICLPENAEQLNPQENDENGTQEPVGSDTNLRALPSQRKGRGRPARLKSVVITPDILRGTSSKKRNISQIQNSPGRSRISPARKKI